MKRFIVERDILGLGDMSTLELCGPAKSATQAISTLGPKIQWQHTYVTQDKSFCVYLAESEDIIKKHAEMAGLPATKITEVGQIIDPLTATL